MAKPVNPQIGEVVCPHRKCEHTCKVFKFRQRTEGRTSVFTGKVYADCPVHGRFGADGKAGMQDYILTEGKIWGANDKPALDPSAPAAAPASATPPREVPKQATPAPKSDTWKTLLG